MTFNNNKQRVFSASFINSIIKPISEESSMYISNYADEGKALMLKLCNQDVDSYYDYINIWVNNIKSALKSHGVSNMIMEKHFIGNIWHGYIDIYTNNKFFELKVRSHKTCELTTVVQCEIYKRLTNLPYEILHINRNTGDVNEIKPTIEMIEKANNIINLFEKFINYIRTKQPKSCKTIKK